MLNSYEYNNTTFCFEFANQSGHNDLVMELFAIIKKTNLEQLYENAQILCNWYIIKNNSKVLIGSIIDDFIKDENIFLIYTKNNTTTEIELFKDFMYAKSNVERYSNDNYSHYFVFDTVIEYIGSSL